jgi:hypothetical protein
MSLRILIADDGPDPGEAQGAVERTLGRLQDRKDKAVPRLLVKIHQPEPLLPLDDLDLQGKNHDQRG